MSTGDKPLNVSNKEIFTVFKIKKKFQKVCLFNKSQPNQAIVTFILLLFTPAASDWVVGNEELTLANHYCIKNLTAGDLLHARVVAVNPGGRSEPGALAQAVPIREVVGE